MNLMSHLSMDYRLSLYNELVELDEDKVYIVQSSLDDKLYIKKVLYPENHDVFIKLKEISSPHIPKIYEIINLQDRLIIIEEYINGSSLEELLEKYKFLPQNKVIEYTIELCDVLDQLHTSKPPIIHRDIKPSNIIINNDNSLKLIDFDVSRTHKENNSTDTEILGTHGYAAPEQFGFRQSDERTDIYSLGVLINVMLTGNLPIDGLAKGKLSNIISKCVKLDPDKRFQNVKEVKNALLKLTPSISQVKTSNYNNLKLPGFRSGKKLYKIIASLWYGFFILAAFGFFVEDPSLEGRLTDFLISIFFIAITLLLGNFNNLRAKLPLLKSNVIVIQIAGYGIYLFLMLFVLGALLPT